MIFMTFSTLIRMDDVTTKGIDDNKEGRARVEDRES